MKEGLFFVFFLIGIVSIFDTLSQLFLKTSVNSLEAPHPFSVKKVFFFIVKLLSIRRVWFGFCLTFLSFCTWLLILSKADLNFAFSADSMHYIFIAIASKIFLKEKVGRRRWFGTFLIIIGIVLVSLS